jgi:hypothetical protein
MKKLIIICAALLLASPAWSAIETGNSDYTNPYVDDQYTMALWHLDETAPTDTPILDSSTWDDTGHDMEIQLGLNNAWNTGNMELDPTKTWVSSMTGFGNAAKSWYVDNSDSNIGPMSSPDDWGTLSMPHSGGNDFTIEFWMNPDNAGGGWGSRIVKKYTGGTFNVNYASGHIGLGWYAPGGWYSVTDNSTTRTIDAWQHVAITMDNSQDTDTSVISFYYNGLLAYSETTLEGKTFGNWDTGKVTMFNDMYGSLYSARQYTGMLDEVRISNVIRVPEPTTITLLAMSALAFLRRKK